MARPESGDIEYRIGRKLSVTTCPGVGDVIAATGGLWPSSQGKRIRLEGEARKITDGPFTEAKELIGGYWMVQAKSIDEVVEWMKRFPLDKNGGELEIRRLIDVGDFAESEEATAMHERLEKQVRR